MSICEAQLVVVQIGSIVLPRLELCGLESTHHPILIFDGDFLHELARMLFVCIVCTCHYIRDFYLRLLSTFSREPDAIYY